MQTVPNLQAIDSGRAQSSEPQTPPVSNAGQFKALIGLTFVPLIVICWHHGRDYWAPMAGLLEHEVSFKHFVTLFFVLSGFLLTCKHSYVKDIRTGLHFYLDRIAWLWPMHLFCLFLLLNTVSEVFKVRAEWTPIFATNFFMVQTWVPIEKWYFSFNAPSWTMATLAFFYLAFPLVFIWSQRNKAAVLAVTALIALSLVVITNAMHLPVDSLAGASIQGMLYVNPLARLLEFSTGVAAAVIYLRSRDRIQLSLLQATALEFAALALVAFVNLHSKTWQAQATPFITESGAFWLHHSAVSFIPFALLVTVLATQRGLLAKFFGSRAMVFLGEISFAMFMLHGVFIAYFNVNFHQEQTLLPAAYFFAGLLVAAHIVQIWVFQPLRQIIQTHGGKLLAKNFPTIEIAEALIKPSFSRLQKLLLPIEIAACAALLYLAHPTIERISVAHADTIGATATTHDVDFGPWLQCKYALASCDEGAVTVKTVWQAPKAQAVDFYITTKVLDETNHVLATSRYSMDGRHQLVPANELWLDTVRIPVAQDSQPSKAAIAITRGKRKPLSPQSAEADQVDKADMIVPLISEVALQ